MLDDGEYDVDRFDNATANALPGDAKTVARRRPPRQDWEDVRRLLETAAALRPCPELVPRGVYRFASFEEADAWLSGMIARTLARHRSRISSRSAAR